MDEETNFVIKSECENIFTGKIVMIIGILIQVVSKKYWNIILTHLKDRNIRVKLHTI